MVGVLILKLRNALARAFFSQSDTSRFFQALHSPEAHLRVLPSFWLMLYTEYTKICDICSRVVTLFSFLENRQSQIENSNRNTNQFCRGLKNFIAINLGSANGFFISALMSREL
jgi:hypothetical protein